MIVAHKYSLEKPNIRLLDVLIIIIISINKKNIYFFFSFFFWFCVLCFVFCVLCFMFCVLCFVFCVLCFFFFYEKVACIIISQLQSVRQLPQSFSKSISNISLP